MNYLYMDSSALVKRYYNEIGSDLMEGFYQQEYTKIIISVIAVVELGSTFARKLRERNIDENKYEKILAEFMDDYVNEYIKVEVDFELLNLAVKLAKRNALKAYDALQLASAVLMKEGIWLNGEADKITFVVADISLEKAAQAEGFVTINPETFSS
jgi:uncharacterized protein